MEIGDHRPWRLRAVALALGLLLLDSSKACEHSVPASFVASAADAGAASITPKGLHMWMSIGNRRFAITLADNVAARAFEAQLPLTLDMAELNGNEKHADLPKPLPANASRPGTIRSGDLMLYGKNSLVVFYSTFDSAYSYTRLGRVDDPTGLAQALGQQNVRIEFSSQ